LKPGIGGMLKKQFYGDTPPRKVFSRNECELFVEWLIPILIIKNSYGLCFGNKFTKHLNRVAPLWLCKGVAYGCINT
jgi:hypothetical protein